MILSFYSCTYNKEYIKYVEKDKGDSVLYYKYFDLISFKGIKKLSIDSLNYPFVKTIYSNDNLILKAHYNEEKTNQITFFKLQNKWCSHSWHYYDGLQNHTFLISLDTALLDLTYSRNPLDKAFKYPAGLNKLGIKRVLKDTVFEDIYSGFFSDEISLIPDLKKLDIEKYKKICNQVIYSKEYVDKDSIKSAYISYNSSDEMPLAGNDWSWNHRPLFYKSIFFTNFESMKDGDTNLTISEKLENLKKVFDKLNEK
jgi:hypothetical protein